MKAHYPPHPHASPGLASWNRVHDLEHKEEYRSTRITDRVNGFDPPESLSRLLREAADHLDRLTEAHDYADTFKESYLQDLPWLAADIYCFLAECHRSIMPMPCWVVVKCYQDRDPSSHWYGKRTPWIGCLSAEQAELFAPAIQEHYTKSPHLKPDLFVVERGEIHVHSIVTPKLTAAEYVRTLG